MLDNANILYLYSVSLFAKMNSPSLLNQLEKMINSLPKNGIVDDATR